MKGNTTKNLALRAGFIALTCVVTMLINIPIPNTKGYLNLGDLVVLLSALLFGKKSGGIIGGIGSAFADILLGYSHYAPITLIVKGLEGYLCGFVFEKFKLNHRYLATILGGLFMATGYFVWESIIFGIPVAGLSLIANIGQGMVGAVLASIIYPAIKRVQVLSSQV